jgi:hypothetical protein
MQERENIPSRSCWLNPAWRLAPGVSVNPGELCACRLLDDLATHAFNHVKDLHLTMPEGGLCAQIISRPASLSAFRKFRPASQEEGHEATPPAGLLRIL